MQGELGSNPRPQQAKKQPGDRILDKTVKDIPLQHNHSLIEVDATGMYTQEYQGILSDVPPLTKIKTRRLLTPDAFNRHADMVLFMPSLAAYDGRIHAIARAIGSADGGKYVSRLIHGVMEDGQNLTFGDKPVLPGNREDPRMVKIGERFYFTHTVVDDHGFSVALASTADFQTYQDHGVIIPNLGDKYASKDPVIFPDTRGGLLMQVRLKPGIQLVRLDDISQLLEFGADPAKRDAFWRNFIEEYRRGPDEFTYLAPGMRGMAEVEAAWRPVLDQLVDERILPSHPNSGRFRRHPQRGTIWYGPGPTPIKTEAGWLDFPHRGELVAEYSTEDRRFLERAGKRVDDIKLYLTFATLHDLKNPKKLVAVSPVPISTPDPENEMEMNIAQEEFAVPFVKISSGAMRVSLKGKPAILVPVGVNDKYTRMEYLPEREFLNWMLEHGRVKDI